MDNKIVVIGSYIVALVMETDRIPVIGETKIAHNYHKAFGGKGSNQAIQAVRLGVPVIMGTKLGRDRDGADCLALYEKEGMDTRFVFIDESAPTATGFIVCSSDGHNVITIDIGALNNMTKAEIDLIMASVVPGDIVLLQFEIDPGLSLYAAERAKSLGATVVLNPAPAVNLVGKDLSCVDFLTPNETEARLCLGYNAAADITEEELAMGLNKLGCGNVIITMGESGSLLYDGTKISRFGTYKIIPVDSTGAGDAFNAGLVTGLYEGRSIDDTIRFASAVAARSCTMTDTVPSYGTRAEIEDFIARSRE